ncbi:MAG: type II secretion system protein GspE [Candidatus Omnitrophica bacterium]|nr:type II secretion system protein GspE [Candidatus Omnitrophota bacterium]
MVVPLSKQLGQLLIESRLITEEQLKRALEVQKQEDIPLSQVLVELGFLSQGDILAFLSEKLDIPPINLRRLKLDPEVLNLIPKKIIKNYQLIPISKLANVLTVAIADPFNFFAIDDVKSITGFEIRVVVAAYDEIMEIIKRHYTFQMSQEIKQILEDIDEGSLSVVEEGRDTAQPTEAELLRLVKETPVIKLANVLLAEAIKFKASDILIEPLEKNLRVRFKIDGVFQDIQTSPKSMMGVLVSRIKVMSDLNIAEHRLPQDGRFKIKYGKREVDFRISIVPSSFGEKVCLRVLDKSNVILDVDKLGFEEYFLNELKMAAMKPHGMIIVCGPTGAGKSTTLYSILKFVDTPEKNLITVEDPVEFDIAGVNQVTIRPNIGLTFASALRSILRQDPDVIMVGEIRDFETVDIAIKAALTGHLVLSSLHATDVASSVVRLINMGVEPFLITSSIIAVIAQRLVRRLCPKCKVAYEADNSLLQELRRTNVNWKQPVVLFKPKGCDSCRQTGYSARIGIFEIMLLSPQIKRLIMERAPEALIQQIAKKEGMITLKEDGINKAIKGLTSIEEIMRVTAGEQL